MAFVLSGAVAGRLSVCLAHVGALLGVAVITGAGKVINVRVLVYPNDSRSGAAVLRFLR
jgi:hypothetical protein